MMRGSQRNKDSAFPGEAEYAGVHEELNPVLEVLENTTGLIHSESMDLTNDPRFSMGSILTKRLSAFKSLSVLGGLMVGFSSQVLNMKKNMNLMVYDGQLQFISFVIMTGVLFANIIATYTSVAQIYHTNRLETAGPTGFEMACSYYLNPNIVSFRHLAVKSMLNSLPMYLIAIGIRVQVNFDKAVETPVKPTWWVSHGIGMVSMILYVLMGLVIWYIHCKHNSIFKERYSLARQREMPYINHVRGLMTSHSHSHRNKGTFDLDV